VKIFRYNILIDKTKKQELLSLIEDVKEKIDIENCNKDEVIKFTGIIVSSVIISEALEKLISKGE